MGPRLRCCARGAAELPRYGEVPAFTLADDAGQPFGTAQLDGKVWVADFIFTTCPEVCPRMTEDMARLQTWLVNRALDGRVRLVSVSVDPDARHAERLRAYAAQFHARPGTWTFATGSQQAIEDAVVHGFKVAVSREKDDTAGRLRHRARHQVRARRRQAADPRLLRHQRRRRRWPGCATTLPALADGRAR